MIPALLSIAFYVPAARPCYFSNLTIMNLVTHLTTTFGPDNTIASGFSINFTCTLSASKKYRQLNVVGEKLSWLHANSHNEGSTNEKSPKCYIV